MSGGKTELVLLIEYVKLRKPKTIVQVGAAIDQYFDNVTWSLLKEENTKLTVKQRIEFVKKIFDEVVGK